MIEKKYVKGTVAILIVFAIGLVGFYAFSAMYGDGLEKTMEENGVSEGEPIWEAPLDYGDNYSSSLIMGILGFVIVMVVMTGYILVVHSRKKNKAN